MELNVQWLGSTVKSAASEAFGGIYLLFSASCNCSGISHLPTLLLLLRSVASVETFRAVTLLPGVYCYLLRVPCLLILQRLLSQTSDTKPSESGSWTAWMGQPCVSTQRCIHLFYLELSGCLHLLPSYAHPTPLLWLPVTPSHSCLCRILRWMCVTVQYISVECIQAQPCYCTFLFVLPSKGSLLCSKAVIINLWPVGQM